MPLLLPNPLQSGPPVIEDNLSPSDPSLFPTSPARTRNWFACTVAGALLFGVGGLLVGLRTPPRYGTSNAAKVQRVTSAWLTRQVLTKEQQSAELPDLRTSTITSPEEPATVSIEQARLSALGSDLAEAYKDRATGQFEALHHAQTTAEAEIILQPPLISEATSTDDLSAENLLKRSHREQLLELAFDAQKLRTPQPAVEQATQSLLTQELTVLKTLQQQIQDSPIVSPAPPLVAARDRIAPLIGPIATGCLVGGGLGLLLATVRRPRHFPERRQLPLATQLQTHHLGTIPDARTLTSSYLAYRAVSDQTQGASSFQPMPIHPADTKGLARWQTVFTQISKQFLQACPHTGVSARVILISSARAGAGCTTVAASLAHALAATGLRTLLIDANLNTPKLHTLFNHQDAEGLAEMLQSRFALSDAPVEFLFMRISTAQLAILPAGKPLQSSASLLASDRLPKLLKRLATNFDFILIDSPALGHSRELRSLASLADGAVLITSSSRPEKSPSSSAASSLQLPWMGTITNEIDRTDKDLLV